MSDTAKPLGRVSRRDVLRIIAVGAGAGVAWRLGLFTRFGAEPVTHTRTLMGTTVSLTVLGDDPAEGNAAAQATLARMSELEALLTRYNAASEVGRLNATGHVEQASDALLEVLELADRIADLGDGAFDVTIQPLLDVYRDTLSQSNALPTDADVESAMTRVDRRQIRIDGRAVTMADGMALTLDGIGKGYIVDRGVDVLRERGFPNVFVEAGGDLMAAGEKRRGVPWQVGIRAPRSGMRLVARLDAKERAVATSGDYMQPFTPDFAQHHILDPRSGRSAPGLASSTVVAPDAATADGLATLTMVLGAARGRELLEALPDCEGCFVGKDLTVTRTTGFKTA